MQVQAHEAPMKRHTQYVQPADLAVELRGDEVVLVLTHADGRTQRVVLGSEAAKELALLIQQ